MTQSRSRADLALDSRAIRVRLAACCVAALVIVASFVYAPWASDGPVLCISRLVTGIPCPACGLTRSFCALSRGAVDEAFAFHVFGPALFVVTLLAIPVLLVEVARGRRFGGLSALAFSGRLAWFEAGVLIAYHVGRLGVACWTGELAASMRGSLGGAAWRAVVGAT
jgi:hypothetical protein